MQLRRVVVACMKLAKSGRQMRHEEAQKARGRGGSAVGWGVSILTGINMAFYTISSQWKEGTHTEKERWREREGDRESATQGVIAGIVLQSRLHF